MILNMNVQIDYKDGSVGNYDCVRRPYFAYENNTIMLHLKSYDTLVVNMLEVKTVFYPSPFEKRNSTDNDNY